MSTLIKYAAPVFANDTVILRGNVVDSAGKPLTAVYFYIDAQSNPISPEVPTDSDGGFSFVVDQVRNDIWINFYSPGYKPLVFTIQELFDNGRVVLEKQGSSDHGLEWAGLGLAVVGIFIAVRQGKGKKVSGFALMDKYRSLTPTQKSLVTVAGVGVGAIIVYNLLKNPKTPQQKQFLADCKKRLEELATQYGILPSTDLSFTGLANEIVTAINDCGTDEDTIYRVFRSLRNEADLYSLFIAFGVAGYKGCFEGSYFGNVHRTLPEAVTADMTNGEVSQVNSILASKNLTYTF